MLARLPELQAPIAARVRSNLESSCGNGRRRLVRRRSCEPEGGWYAPLRVPATAAEEDRVTRLLEEDGVLVHPGYFFDFPQRGLPRGQPAAAAGSSRGASTACWPDAITGEARLWRAAEVGDDRQARVPRGREEADRRGGLRLRGRALR